MKRNLKFEVGEFWDRASCGEDAYLTGNDIAGYEAQAKSRYTLEPYILNFARFDEGRDRDVLEIGVGLGADHEQWARSGAKLHGIDLTPRAIENSERRLTQLGLTSQLQVGDAENLPFPDNSFDIVYSYGVIHHSPNTAAAAQEILRVLRPGGRFAVMIYHRHSFVGYMLWLRYALAKGKPWTSLDQIYAKYLESPGTKAYTVPKARCLFPGTSELKIVTQLSFGDLLEGAAGQRHTGLGLSFARKIWPRRLIRRCFPRQGLIMLIDGRKGSAHA